MIAQCIQDFSTSYGLPLGLLLAGLVGGFTHCAGMCAPFVLAQTGNAPEIGRLRGALLLPYHLGRMTTYVVLAVLVNGFINLAFLFSDLKLLIAAPLLMTAGLIFFVTAFPRLGSLFPWVLRISVSLPYALIEKMTNSLQGKFGPLKHYALGLMLGFMPCGLVLATLMAAATASGPVMAALSMAAFTVGTMPALILVAIGGQSFKHKFPGIGIRLKQYAMAASAFWLFLLAGLMVF